MANVKKLLQFVRFAILDKWDIKQFFVNDIISKYPVVLLSALLIEKTDKTRLYNFPDSDFGILGISNDTGMFDAYTEKGSNIRQPYKIVRDNYIVYNPYRVNVGSIGIKKNNLHNTYISSAYVVFSTNSDVLPDYVYLFMQSKMFNKQVKDHTTGSVRQTLSFENLCHISIPLPPLEVQHSLVRQYNETMYKSQKIAQEACDIETEMNDYLLSVLEMESKTENKQHSSLLHFVRFSTLYNWNVKYAICTFNPMTLFKSNKYKTILLQTICDINPPTPFPKEIDEVTFLPMECISDTYGTVINQRTIASSTKGYTKFKNGDVIFAKITPCMQNGKCAVVNNLHNGYGLGSTEFHVFRTKSNNLLPEYLHCLLRMRLLRTAAMNYFTGSSGQQRVNTEFFDNLYIPLPSIDVQKKIVEHISTMKKVMKNKLCQADVLRETAKEDFERAVF